HHSHRLFRTAVVAKVGVDADNIKADTDRTSENSGIGRGSQQDVFAHPFSGQGIDAAHKFHGNRIEITDNRVIGFRNDEGLEIPRKIFHLLLVTHGSGHDSNRCAGAVNQQVFVDTNTVLKQQVVQVQVH